MKQTRHMEKNATSQLESAESLLRELENRPRDKLGDEDVQRVAHIVNEYQRKIKAHLHEQQEKKANRFDMFADRVANFCGSWSFLVVWAGIIAIWLVLDHSRNSLFLLSFCLSVFTTFQAAFIQMSQNRQAFKDKQEQMLDNAINYKAEQENREIQNYLRKIDGRLRILEKGLPDRPLQRRRKKSSNSYF
ncbi:DUF1003 domain-containing protein [Paenibacillus xerothermodurans]|uniref:DUF1003 domain-containing protein n=1 Tax=Paenibacillus xerothermodurans TaxID=1977292 RepID=A0A2W1P371_PAEXE|nr:DUF1003 domain-containing protein [Paenibacillus xerothermodurans]PZE22152.1 DUF1003 domain-containing protein [Paenibacillus xerothermodurans]